MNLCVGQKRSRNGHWTCWESSRCPCREEWCFSKRSLKFRARQHLMHQHAYKRNVLQPPCFGLPCTQKIGVTKCWVWESESREEADDFGRKFGALFFGGGGRLKRWKKNKADHQNSLTNSPAILRKIARPKLRNSPQVRSAEPRDQDFETNHATTALLCPSQHLLIAT